MKNDLFTILSECNSDWQTLIAVAKEFKYETFGYFAEITKRFFVDDGSGLWSPSDQIRKRVSDPSDKSIIDDLLRGGTNSPSTNLHINKAFDVVSIFGSTLFQQHPSALAMPVEKPDINIEMLGLDPMNPQHALYAQQLMQEQDMDRLKKSHLAELHTHYLEWVQRETDKATEQRLCITEAITKGAGYMWSSVSDVLGSEIRHPKSRFISCDDIVKDPDSRRYRDNIKWCAVYRLEPAHIVEKKFGHRPGSLRGTGQTFAKAFSSTGKRQNAVGDYYAKDLVEYWEVYSKNGIDNHVNRTAKGRRWGLYEMFGMFNYLAISPSSNLPLNTPQELLNDLNGLVQATQWETPFWYDPYSQGGFPFSELGFHDNPDAIYPIGILRPVIPELLFVDWVFSHLGDRVVASSTQIAGVAKKAVEEIQMSMNMPKTGPFKFIPLGHAIEPNADISKLISYLQVPQLGNDIYIVLEKVLEEIEKRTGLTGLAYGVTNQAFRSATESDFKERQFSQRPRDMAAKADSFSSKVIAKEAMISVWNLEVEDLAPVIGEENARIFAEQVHDFENVIRDNTFTIEAGSTRRKDPEVEKQEFEKLMQIGLPVAQSMLQIGDPTIWNSLMTRYGELHEVDVSMAMVQPRPELAAPNQPAGTPSEEKSSLPPPTLPPGMVIPGFSPEMTEAA